MITTEQWLLEVAEQSQLAQTTCQQLWSDLTSLLIGRLTQGSSTYAQRRLMVRREPQCLHRSTA